MRNRDIEFRAKLLKPFGDLKVGGWFYWNIINGLNMPGYIVDIKTIGQFTSVKDSKGVMIYEGDILKIYALAGDFQSAYKKLKVVQWQVNANRVGWNIGAGYHGTTNFEIVGNTVDNPELLK